MFKQKLGAWKFGKFLENFWQFFFQSFLIFEIFLDIFIEREELRTV